MSKSFNYKSRVKQCQSWFNEPTKARMWDAPHATLMQFIAQPVPAGCSGAVSSIEKLAAWYAREGCVCIANGKSQLGWQGMRRFLDYRFFSARTHIEITHLVGASEGLPTWGSFHLFGLALTFREWEMTKWLGELIDKSRENLLLGRRWGSERRDPFRCYLCDLYCRLIAKIGHADDFGPYADVFNNWERKADLERAIDSACQYHVEQIKVDGEFENNPHDIFPSEILALYRVREKLGLETPWVNHPLLDTPFTQVPEKITYEPDPLVVQAMDLVTKLLPEAVAKR